MSDVDIFCYLAPCAVILCKFWDFDSAEYSTGKKTES